MDPEPVFQADGEDLVDPSMHRFWLIHSGDERTDRQTELRWLRHATAIDAVACKNRTTTEY